MRTRGCSRSQLDLAGRTKQTWPQAKVGQTGQSRGVGFMAGGVLWDGRPRRDQCLLPVPGVLAVFSSSQHRLTTWEGEGLGPARGVSRRLLLAAYSCWPLSSLTLGTTAAQGPLKASGLCSPCPLSQSWLPLPYLPHQLEHP